MERYRGGRDAMPTLAWACWCESYLIPQFRMNVIVLERKCRNRITVDRNWIVQYLARGTVHLARGAVQFHWNAAELRSATVIIRKPTVAPKWIIWVRECRDKTSLEKG